ncbi:hypothetical protein DSO57_1021018 [Entomophthora muscae]|uniref:Uncharacterized protein n=3 Tax=Entomophthora muscae TaxID=34485 RepID=A0ACC2S5I9_9FUNG|nr:hypothetical protein DSO57_1021018 [Entomophthora muscae]
MMSLVWLAGPISGLIMQPLIGTLSDRCESPLGRRRPFLLVGGIGVIFSLFSIGWTSELVHYLGGTPDCVSLIAVAAFVILDIAINTIQAVSRALIVDVLPVSLQDLGNAWAGKMLGLGNVIGYLMGYLDLVSLFPFLGDKQLKVLCFLSSMLLAVTLGITCFMIREIPHINDQAFLSQSPRDSQVSGILSTISQVVRIVQNLPTFVLNILKVQVLAWVGWFPFMFYSTTWVAEFIPFGKNSPIPHDRVGETTRAGAQALLIYSLVSVFSSFILPCLSRSTSQAEALPGFLETTLVSLRIVKRREEGSSDSFFQRLPTVPQMFTFSLVMFGFLMISSILVQSVVGATVIIALCGIPWAVAMWVPYALIGEFVQSQNSIADYQALEGGLEEENYPESSQESLEAGMILGIHNTSIVIPQLMTSLLASFIFQRIGSDASVGWLFPLGGVLALFAALLSTRLWK